MVYRNRRSILFSAYINLRSCKFFQTLSSFLALGLFACLISLYASAADEASNEQASAYTIYLDADQSNNVWSGRAIELGIRAALHEVDWKLGGRDVQLVLKDHHGSTPRSLYNLKQILADENALAVFGGLHSPPLLAAKEKLNESGMLTLVPWAAATPITRTDQPENWIFRLSLDDSKAGDVIINDLVQQSGFSKPFLLLEDTGWGRANERTMKAQLSELGEAAVSTHFFPWGIGVNEARQLIETAIDLGADSFVLVANAPEGITFAKAMLALSPERRKPVRSHWGITGGSFVESIGAEALTELDLRFIQSDFSLLTQPLPDRASKAIQSAKEVLGLTVFEASDIRSPAGFIHAYDLTHLLIAASAQAAAQGQLSGNATKDRAAVKEALEALEVEVTGLIKRYERPFSNPVESGDFDAHEALGVDDFTMARYDEEGLIRLFESDSTSATNNLARAAQGN